MNPVRVEDQNCQEICSCLVVNGEITLFHTLMEGFTQKLYSTSISFASAGCKMCRTIIVRKIGGVCEGNNGPYSFSRDKNGSG